MADSVSFPRWSYFPRNARPPRWSDDVVAVVADCKDTIRTAERHTGLRGDEVLAVIQPGLTELGFAVELSKRREDKIRMPVLFTDEGRQAVAYELDGFHQGFGIALEVEAGRGAQNNGDYRESSAQA